MDQKTPFNIRTKVTQKLAKKNGNPLFKSFILQNLFIVIEILAPMKKGPEMDRIKSMKVLNHMSRPIQNKPGSASKKKAPDKVKLERKQFSAQQIRDKVANALEKSGNYKKAKPKFKRQVSEFMGGQVMGAKAASKEELMAARTKVTPETMAKARAEAESAANGIVKSDVSLNDPNDPNTSEKLKALISSNGFGFSDKEKNVLSQIMGK